MKNNNEENFERICAVTGKKFTLTSLETEFYKKNNLPFPSICPEERQKNRLMLSRSRNLYARKCDKTGQDILSVYPPNSSFTVYSQEAYWREL